MKAIFLVPLLLIPLAGCDQPGGGGGYGGFQTAAVSQSQVVYGTIVGVRQVSTGNNADQAVGAIAGGLAGGLLGNQFGGGSGRDVLTVAGAAGGALAGSQLAGSNRRTAPEWTVRLTDGRSIAIVQNQNFRIGQNVRVVLDGNRARIEA